MITLEEDGAPTSLSFDVAIVPVGYETRCRWVVERYDIRARIGIGLEFGFLQVGSYADNREFFEHRSWKIISGIASDSPAAIASAVSSAWAESDMLRIFIDISSMSREMIANVALALDIIRRKGAVEVSVAYAPSKFGGPYVAGPIRRDNPIKLNLAGRSSKPELPLAAVFGLGCEPGLALGALQVLGPDKGWVFLPIGLDPKFDEAARKANRHLADIFNIVQFEYMISSPTITRGRFEALLNALDGSFRVIAVPFGPKIFAWLIIATIVFAKRYNIGIWTFSSKESGVVVDREAFGEVVWHVFKLPPEARST